MKYKSVLSLLYLTLHVGKDQDYFYETGAVILYWNFG